MLSWNFHFATLFLARRLIFHCHSSVCAPVFWIIFAVNSAYFLLQVPDCTEYIWLTFGLWVKYKLRSGHTNDLIFNSRGNCRLKAFCSVVFWTHLLLTELECRTHLKGQQSNWTDYSYTPFAKARGPKRKHLKNQKSLQDNKWNQIASIKSSSCLL